MENQEKAAVRRLAKGKEKYYAASQAARGEESGTSLPVNMEIAERTRAISNKNKPEE